MRVTLILLLIAGVLLFACGCPRDYGTEEAGNGNGSGMTSSDAGSSGSGMEDAADDQTDADNPCMDGEGDEAVHGEGEMDDADAEDNPCNPCGDEAEADAAVDGDETDNPCNPCEDEATAEGDVVTVILETSKGDIELAVHPDWSPLGAEHFLELVRAGYYDGAPWFRVFKDPGGISVAQAGIAADPAVTAQWQTQTIMDEKVIMGNKLGTVAFGKSQAPNSRSTHIFINLSDNSQALDWQGFPCFAEVVSGMDVAQALTETGSGAVGQGELSQRGIDYFNEVMPDGDIIEKAYIKE